MQTKSWYLFMNNSSYEQFFQTKGTLHSAFHLDALLGPVDRIIGLARSSIPWTVTGSDSRLVLAYRLFLHDPVFLCFSTWQDVLIIHTLKQLLHLKYIMDYTLIWITEIIIINLPTHTNIMKLDGCYTYKFYLS